MPTKRVELELLLSSNLSLKLILEVDGEHHFTEDGKQHDRVRDRYLRNLGYEILRIPGYDVLRDAMEVRKRIEEVIDQRRRAE